MIESVFPHAVDKLQDGETGSSAPLGRVRHFMQHSGNSEIVLAVDLEALVAEAQRFDGERDCLDHMLESPFTIPEDLAFARIPDSQGLGGPSRERSAATGTT